MTSYGKASYLKKTIASEFTKSKKSTVDDETMNELKEAFELFDIGHSNSIDARELKATMKAFGIDAKKEDVRNAMRSIGKEVTETIGFNEFVRIITPKLGDRNSKDEIDKIFRLFDEDKTGKISFKNLKKIAQEIGETLNDQELYEMLEEADRDGDGMINAEEFYRVMRKREDPLDDLDSDDD